MGSLQSDYGPDVVRLILDRTPPVIGQLIGEKLPPRPTTTPNVAPQSRLVMNCHADDGEGSGVAKVEFIVGFDLNSNDQLDKEERRPPIAASRRLRAPTGRVSSAQRLAQRAFAD